MIYLQTVPIRSMQVIDVDVDMYTVTQKDPHT